MANGAVPNFTVSTLFKCAGTTVVLCVDCRTKLVVRSFVPSEHPSLRGTVAVILKTINSVLEVDCKPFLVVICAIAEIVVRVSAILCSKVRLKLVL